MVILYTVFFLIYGSAVILNYNTKLTCIVWLLSIYIAWFIKKPIILLLPIILLIINELLYFYFDIDAFNGQSRTEFFYDLTTTYFIKENNNNTNLTDALYIKNNDINDIMTVEEARKMNPTDANDSRYVKLLYDLNISKEQYTHIRILDMGCGN
jgi:hypothetical protein